MLYEATPIGFCKRVTRNNAMLVGLFRRFAD